MTMHEAEHAMVVPVRATVASDTLSAEALFEIPYVAWGLRDPSLRVAPVVVVSVKTGGALRADSEVAKEQVSKRRADPMTSLREPRQEAPMASLRATAVVSGRARSWCAGRRRRRAIHIAKEVRQRRCGRDTKLTWGWPARVTSIRSRRGSLAIISVGTPRRGRGRSEGA